MRVSQVIQKKGRSAVTVDATLPMTAAIKRFLESGVRSLVVTQGEQLAGVLSIRDLLAHLDRRGADALRERVDDAMTSDVVSVTGDASLEDVEKLFMEKHIQHLPVVEGDRLIGVLTPADVLAGHLHDVQDTNERLLTYISGGYF